MKRIMVSFFAVMTLLVSLTLAAPFDFLSEYIDVSRGWHTASMILRIFGYAITALTGLIAIFEGWQSRHDKKQSNEGLGPKEGKKSRRKALVVAVVSAIVCVMSAATGIFYGDFRQYEKAYVMYDTEIKNFQTTFDEQDLNDPQIRAEFRRAKLDLIQKFQKIRLGLIEGEFAANLDIVPAAYAQDKAWQSVKPQYAESFIYATGSAKGKKTLAGAKTKAIEESNKALIKNIYSEMDQALSKQGLSEEQKKLVLSQVLSDSNKLELLRFAEQSENKFAKTKDGYGYYVVSRVPRSIVAYLVEDASGTKDTLKSIKGFSPEQLMMYLAKDAVKKY